MWKSVIAPTVLVSLLWIAVSTTTSYFLNRLDDTYTHVLYDDREVARAAITMQELLWRTQASVTAAVESGHHIQQEELASIDITFQDALAEATRAADSKPERDLIDRIGKCFARYTEYLHSQASQSEADGSIAAASVSDAGDDRLPHHQAYAAESMELALATTKVCERLFEFSQQLVASSFESRNRLRTRIDLVRFAFMFAGPAIGIIFGFRVARGLHKSISQISVTLQDAQGDLREVGSVEVHETEDLKDLPGLYQQVQEVSARIREVVDELQSVRREAVRAERLAAVGELAAGVAHELRNPLTAVKLLIQTAGRGSPNHALEGKRLKVVEDEIARMENTIQGLLDFARPPKLHRVTHNLRDTLDRALNLVAGRAIQQQVQIEERAPAEPVLVNGDPEQLDMVFLNLLLNGIESMPAGGTLWVTLESDCGSGSCCRVVFVDTGTGIDEAVLKRLFEPFATNKQRGVGLGLAISRRILHEHGGRIDARNVPPNGAQFTVELPLVSSLDSDGAGPPSAAPTQLAKAP